MKALSLLALLLLFGCAGAPKAVGTLVDSTASIPAPTAANASLPARPLTVPAPMTTIVQAVPGQPIVSFLLVFHAGSVDDPPGKEGLTALTAALMAEGGTQELTSAQLLEALFPMAAELSVSTNKELTVLSGRVHRDRLERFLKIFTDVLLEPRFDPKEFDRLRTNAINAIENELRGQDDEGLGKVALDALLYPHHPYGHFTGGTVQALKALTLDDLKAHAARVFTQDRLVVGLAGAVDPALEVRLKGLLSRLPAKGATAVALPPAPPLHGHTWVLQKDSLSTALSMGYAYPLRRGDSDYAAVALGLSYLGEHRQSHGVLFDQLRERRGLNYGDYAYVEHYQQEGFGSKPRFNVVRAQQDFSLWLRPVEPQNAVFATRGALYFLQQLLDSPPPADAFETARGFLIGYTRLWEQTDQRRLALAIDGLYYGTPDFLDSFRQALATLTPKEVQQACQRNLSVDKLNYVYVAKDATGLAEQLRSKAPSPVRYPTPKDPEVLAQDKAIQTAPLPLDPSLIEVRPVKEFMER